MVPVLPLDGVNDWIEGAIAGFTGGGEELINTNPDSESIPAFVSTGRECQPQVSFS